MIIYRAMCEKEYSDTVKSMKFQWNSKFKWFGTLDFVTTRVLDGKFNNSKFVGDRYCRLLKFDIRDEDIEKFSKCGYRELMLSRRVANQIKINQITEVEIPK